MMFYVARCRRAGFTLIEIMIVVAIIAILAGIAVPNFVEARQEANLRACRQNVLTIVKAIEAFLVRHSAKDMCGSSSVVDETVVFPYLIENGYLGSIPRCPKAPISDDGYSYHAGFNKWCGTGNRYIGIAQIDSGFIRCRGKAGHKSNGKNVIVCWYFGGGNINNTDMYGWGTGPYSTDVQ